MITEGLRKLVIRTLSQCDSTTFVSYEIVGFEINSLYTTPPQ